MALSDVFIETLLWAGVALLSGSPHVLETSTSRAARVTTLRQSGKAF